MEPAKRIEIALLAGMVAHSALEMQRTEYDDLLKLQFKNLIDKVKDLQESMPWSTK